VGKKATSANPGMKKRLDRVAAEQERMTAALEALATIVGADLPAWANHEALDGIRRRLEDVVAAQDRTNHLLELALRAGFDDDERVR